MKKLMMLLALCAAPIFGNPIYTTARGWVDDGVEQGSLTFTKTGSVYKCGSTTYYNSYDGQHSSTSYTCGSTTYYNDSDGRSGTAYDCGSTTYFTNYGASGFSGTEYDCGSTTYYNSDDGLSGGTAYCGGYNSNSGRTSIYSPGDPRNILFTTLFSEDDNTESEQ